MYCCLYTWLVVIWSLGRTWLYICWMQYIVICTGYDTPANRGDFISVVVNVTLMLLIWPVDAFDVSSLNLPWCLSGRSAVCLSSRILNIYHMLGWQRHSIPVLLLRQNSISQSENSHYEVFSLIHQCQVNNLQIYMKLNPTQRTYNMDMTIFQLQGDYEQQYIYTPIFMLTHSIGS